MGVGYREVDVSRDPAAAAEMVQRSGQRGVPVIAIDDQVVVGFDPQRIQALLGKASHKRPALGLSIADASRMAVKAGALPVFGAYVGKVAPGSPAEQAGIKPGDIITEANFRPISNAADLEKVLQNTAAGSKLALVAMRGDRTLRFQITL